MKGYKVVNPTPLTEDKFESCSVAARTAYVIYEIGKETVPRSGAGPLAVFTDLKSAIKFADEHWHKYIFECEYEQSETRYLNNGQFQTYDLPYNSDFADSVTLTDLVWTNPICSKSRLI